MEYFIQQLINGVTLGSIYGLIAIGYTMVYGIIGMINFAHGDIFMVGAFIALITLLAITAMGITFLPVALLNCPYCFHAYDISLGLECRAHSLSATARILSPCSVDHGDRHVHRVAELRTGRSGRTRQTAATTNHRRHHHHGKRRLSGSAVLHADPDHRDNGIC